MKAWLERLAPFIAALFIGAYVFYIGEDARDQSCALFETQHLTDVQQLTRTYNYLETVPPEEMDSSLNQAVLRGLKAQESRARTDAAPDFCDGGSVFHGDLGRPEPDPDIPKRPESL